MQQLTHLCELMRELRKEQTSRHHEETAPFRAASSTSSSDSLSDNENPNNFFRLHRFQGPVQLGSSIVFRKKSFQVPGKPMRDQFLVLQTLHLI